MPSNPVSGALSPESQSGIRRNQGALEQVAGCIAAHLTLRGRLLFPPSPRPSQEREERKDCILSSGLLRRRGKTQSSRAPEDGLASSRLVPTLPAPTPDSGGHARPPEPPPPVQKPLKDRERKTKTWCLTPTGKSRAPEAFIENTASKTLHLRPGVAITVIRGSLDSHPRSTTQQRTGHSATATGRGDTGPSGWALGQALWGSPLGPGREPQAQREKASNGTSLTSRGLSPRSRTVRWLSPAEGEAPSRAATVPVNKARSQRRLHFLSCCQYRWKVLQYAPRNETSRDRWVILKHHTNSKKARKPSFDGVHLMTRGRLPVPARGQERHLLSRLLASERAGSGYYK